ncbi:unnamed protein product, partial [Rotaria sp. Silwood1]
MEVKLDGISSE